MGRIRVLCLWLADLLCIYGIWAVVVWAYWAVGLGHYRPLFYLKIWPIGLAFTGLNALFRLYHGRPLYPSVPFSPVEELRRLVGSAAFTHILLIAFLALARGTTDKYSRVVIVLCGVLTAFLAQPVRDLMRRLLKKAHVGLVPAFFLGAGERTHRLVSEFRRDAYWGIDPLGYCADAPADGIDAPYLGKTSQVADLAHAHGVGILFVCQRKLLSREEFERFSRQFTHIEYLPPDLEFPTLGSQIISVGGMGGLEIVNLRRMPALGLEKWLLDKALAVLAFLFSIPLFLVVPILIKLTSRGPVFYRQMRLGRNGREIRVWKFRTMYANADQRLRRILTKNPAAAAEWKAHYKLAHDPRVTPLGRILRTTSIDELPQLFNVFAGDMSLVGPRPIVRAEVAYYGESYPIFSSVLPGVTGLWQTSGRSDMDYPSRVALDVHYVLNWSPWMDIWIIFKTVSSVLLMKGAR